jgi:NADPH-dependent glutamate synthase beta subunit-like oxidoreductase/ferredoxin
MIHIKIDNIPIEVPQDTSVLEAARSVGISIPSMCFLKGYDNHPSCMVCLVKDKKTGNLLSSCALKVTEGMDLASDDPEVKDARKEALELLMSDHVGDCEAPCSLSCPANMNIPEMNRLIASEKFEEALKVVKEDIALPYILGYICPAPCEKACRRKQVDDAVSVCLLKRFVAVENKEKPVGKTNDLKVAIIGSGPAGLAAAYYLLKSGYSCVIFDKNEQAGGALRYSIPDNELPKDVLDTEVDIIRNLGAEFRFNTLITNEIFESEIRSKFDAVILATGDVSAYNHLIQLFQNSKTGIETTEGTFETSVNGVFASGNVIRSQKMAVRAVAQGKVAAMSAIQYLKGLKPKKNHKQFNSKFDKLQQPEFSEYLKESIPDKRLSPQNGFLQGFSPSEAVNEAKRCMNCDCRKPHTCKLRIYADEYQVDRKKYLTTHRNLVVKHFHHDMVVYEPEKCIRCGLCVDITIEQHESTGLTYIGRGFDVRIDIPFGNTMREALTHTAQKCIEACPTGALAFKILK